MSDLVDGQTFAQIEREGAKGAILGSLMSQIGWPLPRRSMRSSARGIDGGPRRFTEVVLNAWGVEREAWRSRKEPTTFPGCHKVVGLFRSWPDDFPRHAGRRPVSCRPVRRGYHDLERSLAAGLARAMLTTSSSSPWRTTT